MEYIIIRKRSVDRNWKKYDHCLSAKEARKFMANLAVRLYEQDNEIVIRNGRPYDVDNKMYMYSGALWDFLNYDQDRYRAIPKHVFEKGINYYDQTFSFYLKGKNTYII